MRFKSRPVEIEAEQFTPEHTPPGVCFCPSGVVDSGAPLAHVHTIAEGHAWVSMTDWVVKEPIGAGYYPVKHEIFVKRWERV